MVLIYDLTYEIDKYTELRNYYISIRTINYRHDYTGLLYLVFIKYKNNTEFFIADYKFNIIEKLDILTNINYDKKHNILDFGIIGNFITILMITNNGNKYYAVYNLMNDDLYNIDNIIYDNNIRSISNKILKISSNMEMYLFDKNEQLISKIILHKSIYNNDKIYKINDCFYYTYCNVLYKILPDLSRIYNIELDNNNDNNDDNNDDWYSIFETYYYEEGELFINVLTNNYLYTIRDSKINNYVCSGGISQDENLHNSIIYHITQSE